MGYTFYIEVGVPGVPPVSRDRCIPDKRYIGNV